MKFYKLIAAALVVVPAWAAEVEQEFKERMEKMDRDGESWACIGDAMLMLVGDFKGTTKQDPGMGALIVNGDFENPRGSNSFLHGLDTRVWTLGVETNEGNSSSEIESFTIMATFKELINNTPVKGEYGRVKLSYSKNKQDIDVLEHSEFKCQRYDGWRTLDKDGQYENVYPTYKGFDIDVFKEAFSDDTGQ